MNSAAHGRGDDDQRDVDGEDQAGVRRTGRGQHGEADELHGGHAEVAAAGVEAERPALQALRVEARRCWPSTTRSCRRRRRRRAATTSKRGERHARLQHDRREDRRHEEQRRADDRPVAPAELGDGERVRDAQHGADRRRHAWSAGTSGPGRSRSPGRGTARTPTTCSRCRTRCARRRSRRSGCAGRRACRRSPRTRGPPAASRRSSVIGQRAGRSARGWLRWSSCRRSKSNRRRLWFPHVDVSLTERLRSP